jgi:hypothetical protein
MKMEGDARALPRWGVLETIDCLSVIDAVSDAHFSAVQNAMEVDDLDTLFAESVRIPE